MPPGVDNRTTGLPPHGERRASARYRTASIAYVQLGAENGGVLLDVSENGLRLSAGETLGWDDAIPVSLQLTYRADPIQATAKIVWLSESKRTAGLQFVSLPEMSRARLRDWIAQEADGGSVEIPAAAGGPAAAPRPARRPLGVPASSKVVPLSSDRLRKQARSERFVDALLEQQLEVAQQAAREETQDEILHNTLLDSAVVEQEPLHEEAPPLPPPAPSRWARTDAGAAIETPDAPATRHGEQAAGRPASPPIPPLPSDKILGKQTQVEQPPDCFVGQKPVIEQQRSREEPRREILPSPPVLKEQTAPRQAAREQPAPEPSPALAAPSRWGRSEPSLPAEENQPAAAATGTTQATGADLPAAAGTGPGAAAAATPPPPDDIDAVRKLFQPKQAIEKGSAPALPLHEDSRFKFAEWARARRSVERDIFSDELVEQRRPTSFRMVFAGGLMLLCFAVGLIIGVNYLAGPTHPADVSAPSTNNEDANAAPPVPAGAIAKTPANTGGSATPVPSTSAPAHSAGLKPRLAASPKSEPAPKETASVEPTLTPQQQSTPAQATSQEANLQPTPQQTTPQQTTPQPARAAVPSSADTLTLGNAVQVTPPAEGSPAMWVRLPQNALSASESVAISVQQSVLVPPASALGSARPSQIVTGGRIASASVEPLVSSVPVDPNGDVVHLRIWIDPQGEIRQITPGGGRADLIAIAEGEVRGWMQTPARVGGKPIDSVEDVTITFRPMP
jgi:PilZ domain